MRVLKGTRTTEFKKFENELLKIELSNGRIVWASDIYADATGDVIRVEGSYETPPESYSENVELNEYSYKCLDENDRNEVLTEVEAQEVDKAVRKWCESAVEDYFGM